MVIRCERCSTMYELDDSLLAPTGSQVQCTKCQHVFTAFPPRSAGRTLVGMPSQPPVAEAPAPSPAAPRAADVARPPRTSVPAVYRPPASAASASSVGRAPVLRRDTVGTFEARLRWSARWRWLAPAIAIGVVVAVAAGWLLLGRRGDGGTDRDQAEALALIALDDTGSLDEAATRLEETFKRVRKLRPASADRVLALALWAAALADEREALAGRLALRSDERERLRRDEPPGWQEAERATAAEIGALEAEVRARDERVRGLVVAAGEQLRALQAQVADAPEVVRAAAVLHAARGERDQVHKLVRTARERGRRDAWLDLAEGWMDARDPERPTRERALVRLGALAAARPDLLRGRYLLSRAQASLGRRAEALATADGVLAANPRHDGAKRLREDLWAPAVPAAPAPAPVPVPAPGVKAVPQTRKWIPQAAPGTSIVPGNAAPVAPAPRTRMAPPVVPAAPPAPAGTSPAPADPVVAPEPADAAPPAPAPRRLRPAAPPEPQGQGG